MKALWWKDDYGHAKVMAVKDGYAMMRRPGSVPFVVCVRDLLGGKTKYVPAEKPVR